MRAVKMGGAVPLPIASTSTDIQLYGRGCILRGWVLGESAGTPAQCTASLYDGFSISSMRLARINLLPNTDEQVWFADEGVQIKSGLLLHLLAGSIAGAVFIIPAL